MDGITNIPAGGQFYTPSFSSDAIRQHTEQATPLLHGSSDSDVSPETLKELAKKFQELAPELNQRLEFMYNKELRQVVVKVVDNATDTVIKELPPAELQRVQMAIGEAIGILIDKKA